VTRKLTAYQGGTGRERSARLVKITDPTLFRPIRPLPSALPPKQKTLWHTAPGAESRRWIMGGGDTLVLWREKMIQKLRERSVPEADLERRADEMMAPILAVQGVVEARRNKATRRMRARGWPEDKIDQALVELALRRGDRFVRQWGARVPLCEPANRIVG
jgi:hypothetical protein